MTEPTSTRRGLLRLLGATATTGVVGASTVSAVDGDDVIANHLPDHVTMYSYSDQQALLNEYQPKLTVSHLDVSPEAVYCAYFESTEHDTDCLAYWTWYPTQQGLSTYDSHYGDREPVLVFVGEDGAVERIHYSGWHYLVARVQSPPVSSDSGSHPLLNVVNPHHHYVVQTGTDIGSYPALDDFVAVVQAWYDNGWRADPDTVLNPWTTNYRDSWWQDGEFGVKWLESQAEFSLRLAKLSPFRSVKTDL